MCCNVWQVLGKTSQHTSASWFGAENEEWWPPAQIEPLPEHISEELYHSSHYPHSSHAAGQAPAPITFSGDPPTSSSSLQPATGAPAAAVVWQRQQDLEGSATSSEGDYIEYDEYLGSKALFSEEVAGIDAASAGSSGASWPASPAAALPQDTARTAHRSRPVCAAQHVRKGLQQGAAAPADCAALGSVMGASLWHSSLHDVEPPAEQLAVESVPAQGGRGEMHNVRERPTVPYRVSQDSLESSDDLPPAQQVPQPIAWAAAGAKCVAGGGASVSVSTDLLLRYYQLEAFAAEYYTWFISQQETRGRGNATPRSSSEVGL